MPRWHSFVSSELVEEKCTRLGLYVLYVTYIGDIE